MGIKNKKSEIKEIGKDVQLKIAETKRHANIYGYVIGGVFLILGAALATTLTLPLAIIGGAITIPAGIALFKCALGALKNQRKALELQESIVEAVEDKDEAMSMQLEASKELDKEKKKNIARIVALGVTMIIPATNTITNALGVEGINKDTALRATLSGLALLGSIIGSSELYNGFDHQKVLTLKQSPWNYKMNR